jgi:very-short-patch-repair endonuclease
MTPPEVILWVALRNRQLGNLKFRRQHPVGIYVADFYCYEARLVVEIDGPAHFDRVQCDRLRDEWMHGQGLRVLRIPAMDVFRDLDSVLRTILDWAQRPIVD